MDRVESKEEDLQAQLSEDVLGPGEKTIVGDTIFSKKDADSGLFVEFVKNLVEKNLADELTVFRTEFCKDANLNMPITVDGTGEASQEQAEANQLQEIANRDNFYFGTDESDFKKNLLKAIDNRNLDFKDDIFAVMNEAAEQGGYAEYPIPTNNDLNGAYADSNEDQAFADDGGWGDFEGNGDFGPIGQVGGTDGGRAHGMLPSKGQLMFAKYDFIEKIDKRFGKGKRFVGTETGADNYEDPRAMDLDKRKIKGIAGIKKKPLVKAKGATGSENGDNAENGKGAKPGVRLEFDWDILQFYQPAEFFGLDGKQKNKQKKAPRVQHTLDELLGINRNMKGIDYNIKPEKFRELFTRVTDPPNFLEWGQEDGPMPGYESGFDGEGYMAMDGPDGGELLIDDNYGGQDGILPAIQETNEEIDDNGDFVPTQIPANQKTFKITDLKEFVWNKYFKTSHTPEEEPRPQEQAVTVPFEDVYTSVYGRYKHENKFISVQSTFLTILHLSNEKGLA